MSISNQAKNHINEKIVNTAMTVMVELRNVLQLVVNYRDDRTLARLQLVHQKQRAILQIIANASNQLHILCPL